MLQVMTPEQVWDLLPRAFSPLVLPPETVSLEEALGRVLAEDISAREYVPDFNRSTVDGYALRARDTFGCSDAIPAILPVKGEVLMGQGANLPLEPGTCCAVPTGGAIPDGADCAVMIEYTEDYGDGIIGVTKPAAPGQNMIFRGDDVYPGKVILRKGRLLTPQDIGALAAAGCVQVPVTSRPVVGILSTGDELISPEGVPGPGQIRDVNRPMLRGMLQSLGAEVRDYGIIKDEEALLQNTLSHAIGDCHMALLSGGSSVGVKDAACRVLQSMGEILFHGIAIKPGKPTILARVDGKPVWGLPGHPVAANFITELFVRPLLAHLLGRSCPLPTVTARLRESVSANHGRAQVMGVHLKAQGSERIACPIRSKSGLITSLAGSDGYFLIPRDCEGLPQGAEIQVTVNSGEKSWLLHT